MWRNKQRFDYDNTCPLIDGEINKIKDALDREIYAMIEYLCPSFTDETIRQHTDDYVDSLYRAIEREKLKMSGNNLEDYTGTEDITELIIDSDISDLKNNIILNPTENLGYTDFNLNIPPTI